MSRKEIVTRLRETEAAAPFATPLQLEAADEIERLRGLLKEVVGGSYQDDQHTGGITRDTLWDSLKIMPNTPSNLEVHCCLVPHELFDKLKKELQREILFEEEETEEKLLQLEETHQACNKKPGEKNND